MTIKLNLINTDLYNSFEIYDFFAEHVWALVITFNKCVQLWNQVLAK